MKTLIILLCAFLGLGSPQAMEDPYKVEVVSPANTRLVETIENQFIEIWMKLPIGHPNYDNKEKKNFLEKTFHKNMNYVKQGLSQLLNVTDENNNVFSIFAIPVTFADFSNEKKTQINSLLILGLIPFCSIKDKAYDAFFEYGRKTYTNCKNIFTAADKNNTTMIEIIKKRDFKEQDTKDCELWLGQSQDINITVDYFTLYPEATFEWFSEEMNRTPEKN